MNLLKGTAMFAAMIGLGYIFFYLWENKGTYDFFILLLSLIGYITAIGLGGYIFIKKMNGEDPFNSVKRIKNSREYPMD